MLCFSGNFNLLSGSFDKLYAETKSRSSCSPKTIIHSRDQNALDFGIIFVAYQNDTDHFDNFFSALLYFNLNNFL